MKDLLEGRWIARIVPAAMNLIDALLREARLLWQPIVILLHPAVEETLTSSIQEVYRLL